MIGFRVFRVFFALVILGLGARQSEGVVIRVDPVNGDDLNNGAAWVAGGGVNVGPKQTVQGALDAIEALGNGVPTANEVWLKIGTYQPTTTQSTATYSLGAVRMISDVKVRGGFEGTETGPGQRPPLNGSRTIIDGSIANGGAPAAHVVIFEEVTDTLLEAVTVRGGRSVPGVDGSGGGLMISLCDGSNVISNCWIIDNEADAGSTGGGGSHVSASSPVFRRCLIAGNSVESTFGGGVSTSGADSGPTFENCVVAGNSAGRGAGLSFFNEGERRVANCLVIGNSSTYGAGVYMDLSGGSVNLVNSVIAGNSGGQGGGVFASALGSIIFTNVTIAENGDGNGIAMSDFGPDEELNPVDVRLRNVIVADNRTYGVLEQRLVLDPAEVKNCLFSGNLADYGDEISTSLNGADAINAMMDTDSSGNVDGNPLFVHGPGGQWEAKSNDGVLLTMTDNHPDSAPFAPNAFRGTLVKVDTTQKFVLYVVGNTENSVTFIAAPAIQDLISDTAEYEARNYRLQAGSAARDAGLDLRAETPETATDIVGAGRPQGAGIDIGAYEFPVVPGVDVIGIR